MKKGFTLLELLIVVTLIGIAMTIGGISLQAAIMRARVNDATTQLSADFQRLRNAAQRHNVNASITFPSAKVSTYSYTIGGKTIYRVTPKNVEITLPQSPLKVTYAAPYGERASAASTKITVADKKKPAVARTLKIVGVTGKVYLQ